MITQIPYIIPPLTIPKQVMKELANKFDAQTIRTVAEVQDQLRHPSAKALVRELHVRGVRSRGQHVRLRKVCHTAKIQALCEVLHHLELSFSSHVVG